jgi:hypothetical protein
MQLVLSTWTHHLNQLIYSFYYYCKQEKTQVKIVRDESITNNGGLLLVNGESFFFDYSDDSKFIDDPKKFTFYFKRSLRVDKYKGNVYPLNFNVPLAYKSHGLLPNLKSDLLFDKWSRPEVIKAIDRYAFFTKSSHGVLDVRRYPKIVTDNGGKIIYHTRLWNPDNHPDDDEKERRRLQNEFRINACRIIKKNYSSASVGLFSDDLAKSLAPDLLLDFESSKKNNYLNNLSRHNIAIADDGLKDTPGWKIGEYLLFGKAVITTPLNIAVDNFEEHKNFEQLSTRTSYVELPDKIEFLLKNKKYLEMGNNNLLWSDEYLHPKNYIKRILALTGRTSV